MNTETTLFIVAALTMANFFWLVQMRIEIHRINLTLSNMKKDNR